MIPEFGLLDAQTLPGRTFRSPEYVTLTNARPGRSENLIVYAVVIASVFTLVLITPFARVAFPQIAAFIPAYESALAINDLITAVLLIGHFLRARSPALLILSCGYLFDMLTIIPHVLTFPGVFASQGLLGAGPQTAAWLFIFWHGGFALFVVAYALASRADLGSLAMRDAGPTLAAGIAVTVALVFALTLLAIAGQGWLPSIMEGGNYSMLVSKGISPAICASSLLALALLWPRRKTSTLDLWLLVVMCAWLCDVVLSAVVGANRFDLGWYGGRSFGLLAGSFLLIVLLLEFNQLYGTLARRTEQLQASESSLRAIFETTHLYQALLSREGAVAYANSTSLGGINATLSSVIGRDFWQTLWFAETPGMPEMVRDYISVVSRGGTVRRDMQLQLPVGLRGFDFALRPILDEQGVVTAMVSEAVDITERRAAEEALRQSQKMEAVGQLTGGLAHDFNNLLTVILAGLGLLQKRVRQGRTSDLAPYVESAQNAAHQAAALIHRLLAFSRRQALDPRPANLTLLVGGMEELIRRTMGPAITIEVSTAAGLWTTLVDANQLESALLNLCINARDAMPAEGLLAIETANLRLDERMARQRELPPGQYVSLCVSDTGTGMTPEVIAQAFTPFFTTKPVGVDTGLGLSMVYASRGSRAVRPGSYQSPDGARRCASIFPATRARKRMRAGRRRRLPGSRERTGKS
jgi:signal transduction histidine kinase